MNKLAIVTLVGVLAANQIACGSDDEGTSGGSSAPDFAALETKLSEPSGTFGAGQEGAVQDGFGKQQEAAGENPFGGSGSGSSSSSSVGEVSIKNVHPMAEQNCSAIGANGGKGSCACPSGGTLEFDIPAQAGQQQQNGQIDQTVSIVANACAMKADEILNGSIYWKIKNPPLLQIYSIHIKLSGKKVASYDVDYMNKDGVITFAVEVADGRVLVSAKGNWNKETKTGTLVIKDKNETWTCQMTNGKGECKSDKGQVRQVGG